uniref:Uncharacterized protein n=1 Tax=Medicago truncatula TaxID=3880 RepID=Q2HRP3_MEDTR|nr:hypothetical protein MtrDRAFT_AC158464g33v2 [Medicago truncatula]
MFQFCLVELVRAYGSIPVTMFEWQAEMSVPAALPKTGRVVTPLPPVASPVISFAQTLTASIKVVSNDNLPQPLIRGEQVSIKITQNLCEKGTEVYKQNHWGRLILNKGDKPYSKYDIQTKLQKIWKTTATWSMMPLGRGYYEFFF